MYFRVAFETGGFPLHHNHPYLNCLATMSSYHVPNFSSLAQVRLHHHSMHIAAPSPFDPFRILLTHK